MRTVWPVRALSSTSTIRCGRRISCSLVTLVLALSVTGEAFGQGKGAGRGAGKGAQKGAAGKGAPDATPARPIPPFRPKQRGSHVIRYHVLSGKNEPECVLTVRNDGIARYVEGSDLKKSGDLGEKITKKLADLVKKAKFDELQPVYGDRSLIPDPHSKTISIKNGGRTKTVQVFEDNVHPAPDGFTDLANALKQLIDKRLKPAVSAKIPFSGVGATAQIDRRVYVPSVTGVAPTMWAALAVTNTKGDPIQVEFPSQKKYDFAIRNEAGVEVHRWSTGRSFGSEPARLTIRREGISFTESIPLVDGKGAPLPAGDYQLAWRLEGSLGYSGQLPFRIAIRKAPSAGDSTALDPAKVRAAVKARAGATRPRPAGAGTKEGNGGRGAGKGARGAQGPDQNP